MNLGICQTVLWWIIYSYISDSRYVKQNPKSFNMLALNNYKVILLLNK